MLLDTGDTSQAGYITDQFSTSADTRAARLHVIMVRSTIKEVNKQTDTLFRLKRFRRCVHYYTHVVAEGRPHEPAVLVYRALYCVHEQHAQIAAVHETGCAPN